MSIRFLLCTLLSFGSTALALETDQYSNRKEQIDDCTLLLNLKVNQAIAEAAAEWKQGENEWKFVNAVWRKIGGLYWVDKLERWAMKSPEVGKLSTRRWGSVYRGLPFYATRVVSLYGIGKTFRINGVLVGSDKIGHFLSQGRKFYRRYRRSNSEDKAARRSSATESGIFGQKTTGCYSNADLVANYEGYRFYRSLFHEGIVEGKPAILRWENGKPVVQRAFDWADHVNTFWDEVLNPNHFDNILAPHMRLRLEGFCTQYQSAPQLWDNPDYDVLWQRYSTLLRLRNSRDFLMSNVCEQVARSQVSSRAESPR